MLGSSGNHGQRRKPGEALSVNAAIDAIKVRHGFDSLALAGQSGGSTIAASLLTLGRRDIACAVLGSGNLAVVDLFMERQHVYGTKFSRAAAEGTFYDPARNVSRIVPDAVRRVLVIGDTEDKRTPFPQQQRFAELLRKAGHHAHVIPITGTGPENHGAAHAALPAAALCLQAVSDEGIGQLLMPKPRVPAATTSAALPGDGALR